MNFSVERKVAAGFAGILALLTIMGMVSCWYVVEWQQADNQVHMRKDRIACLTQLLSDLETLETAERAFAQTRAAAFSNELHAAGLRVEGHLKILGELARHDAGATESATSLGRLSGELLTALRQSFTTTNTLPDSTAATAQAVVLEKIRTLARTLEQADEVVLQQSEPKLAHSSKLTQIGVMVGGFVVVAVVGWAWLLIRKDAMGRRHAEAMLRAANDQLEAGVRDRTAALSRSLASLTESEARMAGIISSAMDGIITVDAHYGIVLFNEAAEKMFQRRAADMIGQPLEQLIPERLRASHFEHLRSFADTTIKHRAGDGLGTTLGLRANGEEFPIESSISQLNSGGGKLFTLILRDITERRRAEIVLEERAELEGRLSKIVAAAPGVIYSFRLRPDGSECYPFVSPAIQPLLGLQPAALQATSAPLRELVNPEDAERMRASAKISAQELSPWREEFRVRHPRRGELWLEANALPEREADGGTLWYGVMRDISERKLTEQQIRYQFHLLKSITERAAECIFVTDLQGRVTFANPEAENVFGYPLEEIIGENLHEKIHHHYTDGRLFPADDCHLEHARDEYQPVRNQELVFFRKDGSPVSTLCSTAPLEVAGRAVGVVLVVRDITDLKKAEKALRTSNAQLEAAQELAGMGSFEVQLATDRITWSRPASRLLGFDPARPPATLAEFLAFIHPEDRALFGHKSPDWLESVRLEAFDFRSDPARGPLRHFAAKIDLDVDAHDRPAACKGTLLDVTQRKQAEAAVRESEERIRQIAASFRDAIWLIDSQTQEVLYVNPAFESICGISCEDFYRNAEAFNELIHPEDKDRVLRAYFNGASLGAVEERHRIIRPDGSMRWVQGRTVAVKNEAGECYRIACIVENVTRRVEAEHLQRSLEEQLRQSQKMDAIGTLAGGIAHDFNNVLAGILGSVELACMEIPPDHSAQQFLQSILTASNRARELVQQILTFSRRKESERSLMQLQPVLAECVKLLRSTLPAMVRITHRVDNACPPIMADAIQIHQVITNICTNAWHALPAADGHIEITLAPAQVTAAQADRHPDLKAGLYLRLTVKDNGHGMDLATQQRIFEPFFTTKPSGRGTGLGLSVAHGIVKSHQGAIMVESAPGRGSTFSIYFPAQAMTEFEEPARPRELPLGQGERILFVDDEQNLAAVTEKVLTRIGYRVTRFHRSELALERFRESPNDFDLVITDLAMPGMTGTDLAAALLQVRSDIPILLISGFVDQPVHEAAQVIGIREVLLKPLSIEGLSDAVSRALAGARAANSR